MTTLPDIRVKGYIMLYTLCVSKSSVKVSPDGMDSLVALSQGDMRRSLNILQSTSMAHDEVTEETVYLCTGQPLPSDIAQIVEWMLNVDFSTAYTSECVHVCKCMCVVRNIVDKILKIVRALP